MLTESRLRLIMHVSQQRGRQIWVYRYGGHLYVRLAAPARCELVCIVCGEAIF